MIGSPGLSIVNTHTMSVWLLLVAFIGRSRGDSWYFVRVIGMELDPSLVESGSYDWMIPVLLNSCKLADDDYTEALIRVLIVDLSRAPNAHDWRVPALFTSLSEALTCADALKPFDAVVVQWLRPGDDVEVSSSSSSPSDHPPEMDSSGIAALDTSITPTPRPAAVFATVTVVLVACVCSCVLCYRCGRTLPITSGLWCYQSREAVLLDKSDDLCGDATFNEGDDDHCESTIQMTRNDLKQGDIFYNDDDDDDGSHETGRED